MEGAGLGLGGGGGLDGALGEKLSCLCAFRRRPSSPLSLPASRALPVLSLLSSLGRLGVGGLVRLASGGSTSRPLRRHLDIREEMSQGPKAVGGDISRYWVGTGEVIKLLFSFSFNGPSHI